MGADVATEPTPTIIDQAEAALRVLAAGRRVTRDQAARWLGSWTGRHALSAAEVAEVLARFPAPRVRRR